MAMDLTVLLSAKDNASAVLDKLKNSTEGAAKGIEGAFGGALSKFNLFTGAVGAMAAVAAGGVFSKVVKETIEWTSEAVALGKSLGITTQQASILNVALGDVYLSKDTMIAGSLRIAKTLKSEEEAFTKLGVATRDQNGNYRSTLNIMTDVNTKLGNIREGTDRNVAGMAIYGKSWGELSSLLKLNNEVMDEAAKKAKELGLIVGTEQVSQMKKYKAAINDIEDVGKSLTLRFGNVLLPNLVKVGAWLGNNGPVLARVFDVSLQFLGKTVTTLGEWFGLMAYRAVAAFGMIKSGLSGDFAGVKQQFIDMVAAGEDYNARTAAKWKDWKPTEINGGGMGNKDPLEDTAKAVEAVTTEIEKYSKSVEKLGKEQLDLAKVGFTDDLKKQQELLKSNSLQVSTLEQPLRNYLSVIDQVYGQQLSMQVAIGQALWQVKADQKAMAEQNIAIATVEKSQMDARLKAWQEYLKSLQGMHSASVDSMKKKQQELYDIQTKTGDLTRQVQQKLMTPLEIYYSNVADLETKQKTAMALSSEEKIKLLGQVQQSWANMTNEIKEGDNVLISQADAVASALYKIKSVGAEMELEKGSQIATTQASLDSLAAAMRGAEDMITGYKAKLLEIDNTIANLTKSFELNMNDKATPVISSVRSALDQLRDKTITITANYVSAYSDSGTATIPSYDVGTPYVPSTGLAIIHKGERILTAKENASGNYTGGSINFNGGINFTLPSITNSSTADDLVNQVFPKLMKKVDDYNRTRRRA